MTTAISESSNSTNLGSSKIEDDIYSVSTIHLTKDQALLAPKLLEQLQGNLLNRANDLENAVTTSMPPIKRLIGSVFPLKIIF